MIYLEHEKFKTITYTRTILETKNKTRNLRKELRGLKARPEQTK